MSPKSSVPTPPVEAAEGPPATPAGRPLRADAQRNYDKIVETARQVFRERGADGSLDEVAKRAGVGPGTLYRHFPTREALMDAVMRDWSEQVRTDAQAVIDADQGPRERLLSWFGRLMDSAGIYHGAAAKVMSAMDDPSSPIYRKCRVLADANDRVLGSVGDALRPGVAAGDVMRLVCGVSVSMDHASIDPDEARAMLAIVLNGVLVPDAD